MQMILLVDDAPDILRLIKNLLEQEGLSVKCAGSGEEALSELRVNAFDLMITDYDMPGMDGIRLTRHSRVIAPDMPVILMTGSISSELPVIAYKAGAASVLPKPFGAENLLETIRGVVP